jgi:hypothetical protein
VGIAKKKKCAIMIVAHLRKRGKNEKKNYIPSHDDIMGSGAFKQDSTEVLIATRKFLTDEPDEIRYGNEGSLYVTKSKVGPNGKIGLVFSEGSAKITTTGENFLKNIEGGIDTIKEIFGIDK